MHQGFSMQAERRKESIIDPHHEMHGCLARFQAAGETGK